MRIREHNITLEAGDIRLRPLTESDWDILLKWNSDPEVLYYTEGDDVSSYSLEDIYEIYRPVSQKAFCFVTEYRGAPIGECWLQAMNIDGISKRYRGLDLRRIDLMIGEKELWGHGIGSRVIHMLCEFGFYRENTDIIFGLVLDYNLRSLKAFEKNGFVLDFREKQPAGSKAEYECQMKLTRDDFLAGIPKNLRIYQLGLRQ